MINLKKFELFMCCLGNGITVCNKTEYEHGDYKIIAHIADCGKITWYVDPTKYVPGDALLKIEHCATMQHVKWEKWLDSMTEEDQCYKLLDKVPVSVMLHAFTLETIKERLSYLKHVYYERSCF